MSLGRQVRIVLAAVALVLGSALPVLAAQGHTKLERPSISPDHGSTSTTITLSVTYRSPLGYSPDYVRVKVAGATRSMRGDGSDWKAGVVFTWRGTLPSGTHTVTFVAQDAERFVDELVGGTVVIGGSGGGGSDPGTDDPADPPGPTDPGTSGTPTSPPDPSDQPDPSTPPDPSDPGAAGDGDSDGSGTMPGEEAQWTRDGSSGSTGGTAGGTTDGSGTGGTGTGGTGTGGGAGTGGGPGDPDPGTGVGVIGGSGGQDGAGGGSTEPTEGGTGSGGGASSGSDTTGPDPASDPLSSLATAIGGLAHEFVGLVGDTLGGILGGFLGEGPGSAALGAAALGDGRGSLPTIPTMIVTSAGVTTWMAFMLFGKRRRDEEQSEPDSVLQAAATSGTSTAGTAAIATAPVPDVDPESLMPRWRRPSLLEARKTDPVRAPAPVRPRQSFDHTMAETEGFLERRIVRYAVVQLLDRPDEVYATRIGEVEAGDEVGIVAEQGVYRQVRCPDGRSGWLHRMTLGDVVGRRDQIALPEEEPATVDAAGAMAALLAARGLR